jgi:hypothetical protein
MRHAPTPVKSHRTDGHRDGDVPVILVTGATGVGKSQVVQELSWLLDRKGVSPTAGSTGTR